MTTCVKWGVWSKTELSHTLHSHGWPPSIDDMTLPGTTREYETVAGGEGGSEQAGRGGLVSRLNAQVHHLSGSEVK
jgi:hypothetical protein